MALWASRGTSFTMTSVAKARGPSEPMIS
jgi:hypothetical protein